MHATPAAVAYWKRAAGSGDVDERCARIGPLLRQKMGIVMPDCIWCGPGNPMVYVHAGTGKGQRKTWVHEDTRDRRCFPDEPDLADHYGEVA